MSRDGNNATVGSHAWMPPKSYGEELMLRVSVASPDTDGPQP